MIALHALNQLRYTAHGYALVLIGLLLVMYQILRVAPRWSAPFLAVGISVSCACLHAWAAGVHVNEALVEQATFAAIESTAFALLLRRREAP